MKVVGIYQSEGKEPTIMTSEINDKELEDMKEMSKYYGEIGHSLLEALEEK